MTKTVLLADDDVAIQRVCKDALQGAGYSVACVNNGSEAVKYVQSSKPDLVLLDMLMPVSPGWDVLNYLNDQKSSIPVLILSNVWSPEREDEAIQSGAVGYIQKTDLSLEDLISRVSKVLSHSA